MGTLITKLKSRDITLPTKVCLVKAMVFPVVMDGCESWTVKKAERQRIDAFELWCWRRLLRVPWTARRSNQSILKEISPGCSGVHWKDWCWSWISNTLVTSWTWVWVNSGSWWWTGRPGVLQSVGSQRVRHDWATELNWTESPNNHLHLDLDLIRNVKRDPSQPMVILLWSPLFSSPTVSVPMAASDTLNPKLLLQSCSCDFPSPSPFTPFP